jgi:phytoene dehydrogenase-like protein
MLLAKAGLSVTVLERLPHVGAHLDRASAGIFFRP